MGMHGCPQTLTAEHRAAEKSSTLSKRKFENRLELDKRGRNHKPTFPTYVCLTE
jgi:hypothetical protein